MPSTYSSNLKLELMATGENSGTWGNITNTNLGTAAEQAIVGYGAVNYLSDANLTISITNSNAAQAARALVLNVTSALSLTATRELVVPTIEKQYIVQNNTTGSQSITVKTSAGTGITVPNGRKAHLYVNGTDVIQMFDFVDINGGAIDGTTIGAASASTGAFTTLNASGATTLDGNVTLGNASGDNITFTGTITSHLLFTDNTYDIGASGATRPRNLFLAGNATVGGNLSVGGTLTLTGGVNLNGNVTVGDTSADTLTINATITSNLLFTDNTYDIGASGATRPRNLFLAGNITAGGNQTLTGSLTVDSTTDSSSTTTGSIQTDGGLGVAKALYVGTTANIAGAVTLSGGTANGVAFLDGSKVLTTGSALTYNGTTLVVTAEARIKAASSGDQIRIEPGTAGAGVSLLSRNSADTILTPMLSYGNYHTWYVDGGARGMDLTTSGLMVGTTTATGRVTVAGNVAVGSTGNNGYQWHSNTPTTGNLEWWLSNNQGASSLLQLYYYNSGSFAGTAITVDKSGNTGFATTDMYGRVNIQRYVGAPQSSLAIGDFATIANDVGIYLRTSSTAGISTAGAPLAFYVGGPGTTEVGRFTAAGSLLVGTTTSSAKLTVNGDAIFGQLSPATRYTVIGSTGIPVFRYDDNGIGQIVLQNLGITGSDQGFRMLAQFSGDGTNTYNGGYIQFLTEGAYTGTASTRDSALTFATVTDGTQVEKLRITGGGRVGVNTQTPGSILEVVGASAVDTTGASGAWTLRLRDTAATALAGTGSSILLQGIKTTGGSVGNYAAIAGLKENSTDNNENGYLGFFTVPNSTGLITERARITSGGYLGIGGVPVAPLHILTTTRSLSLASPSTGGGGASYILMGNNDSGGTAGPAIITSANRNIQFGLGDSFSTDTGGTFSEHARFTSAGDLLVGTTSSSGRLTVVTGAGSQAALFSCGSGTTQQAIATFSNSTNNGYLSVAGVGTTSSIGTWTDGSMVTEAVPNGSGSFFLGAYTGDLVIQNGRVNTARFTSTGTFLVGTSDNTTGNQIVTTSTIGFVAGSSIPQINYYSSASTIEYVNRNSGGSKTFNWYYQASGAGSPATLSTSGVWTNASDARGKENIADIHYGLSTVMALQPRQYDVRSDGSHAVGFVAQEVLPIVPELVHVTKRDGAEEFYGLDYGSMAAVLVKAIQELKAEFDAYKATHP